MRYQPYQVQYVKYNSTRRPEYRLMTEICESADGRFVRKRASEEAAGEHLEGIVRNCESLNEYYKSIHVIKAKRDGEAVVFPYIRGNTLAQQIDGHCRDRDAFIAAVNEKLDSVLAVREEYVVPFIQTEAFETLFGSAALADVPSLNPANIDSLLSNFIENEDGIYCIDYEWICHFPVPIAFIKYRILLYLYVTQVHAQLSGVSMEEMLGWFGFSEDELRTFRKMDDHFQQHIHGEDRKHIYTEHYKKKNTRFEDIVRIVHELENQVENQAAVIKNQETVIKNQDTVIKDQDKAIKDQAAVIKDQETAIQGQEIRIQSQFSQIQNLNIQIQNQNIQIQTLTNDYQTVTNAFFWRITKPARVFTDWLKQLIKRNEPVYLFLRMGKDTLRHGYGYAKENRERYLIQKRSIREASIWPTEEERKLQRQEKFPREVMFSILVPLYNTPERFLSEMIHSVQEQTYSNWELCLADGSDAEHGSVEAICNKFGKKDSRIRYRKLKENLGISGNTNACIDMAKGNYIALLDHDDLLHPSALYEVMKAICEQGADYVYTDEVTFRSPDINQLVSWHFKPDFAPDNLLANNYICHFSAFSARLLETAGRFRREYDGSQDHDIILRLTEAAEKVVHVPKVLYWWRSHPQSVAQDITAKEYAVDAAKRAVRDFLRDYRHVHVEVLSTRAFPTIFQIVYPLKRRDKISIIIPNKDHVENLSRCIGSILSKSSYDNYEIVVVENNSTTDEIRQYYAEIVKDPRIRVIRYEGEFNYSRINNWAVQRCDGDYVLLLNNDTEVINSNWLENMLMYAQREDVGAVGAKLYFPDGRIQHAGIILKLGPDRVAGHAFYTVGHDDLGYMGRLCYAQNLSAVTAACLMVKREKYNEAGGMNEELVVALNDVDFCLRLREKGYLNVFTPFAELTHYESVTRGANLDKYSQRFQAECAAFRKRWAKVLDKGDPYYNPNFSLDSPVFEPKSR